MHALLLAALLAAPPVNPAWMTDLEAAKATARKTGKPLFVAFR